jgi:GGDEF domain-containing protein
MEPEPTSEDPMSLGSLKSAFAKNIADNLASAVFTATAAILATAYLGFRKARTPPLGPLPVWSIVVAAILCAACGAAAQYFLFGRRSSKCLKLQIRELQGRIQELSKVTKLDQLTDLVEQICNAVKEVLNFDQATAAGQSLRKALSLAILAIDHYEEIGQKYKISVASRLLDELEKAVVSASPRKTDNVFLVGQKIYIVIRYETIDGAQHLPSRALKSISMSKWVGDDGTEWPDWKASAGIAELKMPLGEPGNIEKRIEELLKHAEFALEKAAQSNSDPKVFKYRYDAASAS